ncbi:MAG: exodeoxyribonuclease VII small subunit [Anaerolineae bacterium]|nr:exodeoxyribonuclease VII small subunit [Gemmatimonadaceae bacterium]
MSFETDLARLDAIVAELERDDVELDRALALFQEGVERLRVAQLALVQTEAQVNQLVERADGGFTLSPLRD